MVRNGKLWYEMVMVQNSYGTKWFLAMVRNCNFVVRNGKLWYHEIAILWYEMVNYGTKWQWYEIVMVRNDSLRCPTPLTVDIPFNPNNPVVILRSRWSLHPAIVPIQGAVLFKLHSLKTDS